MTDKPLATGGYVPGPDSPDAVLPFLSGCDFGSAIAMGAVAMTGYGQHAVRGAAQHQERLLALRRMELSDDEARTILADMVTRSQRSGEPIEQIWQREYAPMFRKYTEGVRPAAPSPFDFADATLTIGDTEIPVTDMQLDAKWDMPRVELPPIRAGRLPEINFTFRADGVDEFLELMAQLVAGVFPAPAPCASRPAPFPAARDYRRRTKHRNRRR
jgi:hypothetical protein